MSRIKSFAVKLILALSLLFISAMQANADRLFYNSLDNDLALSLNPNCSSNNGCKVQIRPVEEGPRFQEWYQGRKNETYQAREIQTASGKCLEVQTRCARNTGDCPVQIWNCNGRQEQLWKFESVRSTQAAILPSFDEQTKLEDLIGNLFDIYTIKSVYGNALQVRCSGYHFSTCKVITNRNPVHKQSPQWALFR